AAAGELLDRVAAGIGSVEIARIVKGQAPWAAQDADAVGKNRAGAATGELLNRAIARVGHVEISRTVKGEAVWDVQAGAGKDRADAAAREFLNCVIGAIRQVENVGPAGSAWTAEQQPGGCDGAEWFEAPEKGTQQRFCD